MFLLAHAGLSLGAAVLVNGLASGRSARGAANAGAAAAGKAAPWSAAGEWATSLGRRIDLRLFLAGTVVSDLIDKPLGRAFYGTFGVRLFGHSLLFLLIVALAGLALYRLRRQPALLVLGLGILAHLMLDGMWLDPHTLLWPVLGPSFPTVAEGNWQRAMWDQLLASPGTYLTELAGAAVLAGFAWLLVRRGQVLDFARHGRL